MDQIKKHVINNLQAARKNLLNIPKEQLTGNSILLWFHTYREVLQSADSISGLLLPINIQASMDGFWEVTDTEVCLELRSRVVAKIDRSIEAVDAKQIVRPILDDLITKVQDTKLATLLNEFNAIRVSQPNLASSGFRTILPLVIRERAKRVDPNHTLATKDDLKFEPDIQAAISHPNLFNDAEKKLLRRYLNGGDKDSFDNVVHKPIYLIEKEELEDAVDLLNHLLPTITD